MNRAIFVFSIVILTAPDTTFSKSKIDPFQKYAWGENVGWTNWRDANGTADGVVVNGTYLSGYVWAENAGWINVGNDPANGTSYANLDGSDFGVNIASNGDLNGFAWSENGGWVNFDTLSKDRQQQQARFDKDDSRFRGWVWSENDGWINLDDAGQFVAVVVLKNRYISMARNTSLASTFDIRLTLTSTLVGDVDPGQIGRQSWANDPDADCISIVGPSQPATPPNWSGCPTVHLTGCAVIPTSTYDIIVIDDEGTALAPAFSAATQALPAGDKWWGDAIGFFTGVNWTDPNGVTNFDDVSACLKTFIDPNANNATHTSITDIHPNRPDLGGNSVHPNKVVNFDDIFQFIQGFKGAEYLGGDLASCTNP